ncbi:MAG TPA: YfhO family protein [Lacibacter sp.]|nr:YfhO family protein [Lacibacter sp.]
MSSAMLQQMSRGQQPTAAMQQEADSFGKGFTSALQEDRKALFGGDLVRTLLLLALTGAVIWAAWKQKLSPVIAAVLFIVLASFDLLGVGKRYLNENNYIEAGEFDNTFALSAADAEIKKDTGYYRVFNQTRDPFNESMTSYHHNSVGGYHPAKLQIYQDPIENQISSNNRQVLNMLNTKYYILPNPQTGAPVAQLNPEAFGPCWLVQGIRYVADAKEEMSALDNTNLRDTAVVQQRFAQQVGDAPVADSTAFVRLIANKNDQVLYESNAASNQFAVFSEVFYDRGWKAFVDGRETPIVKTNYALRGLALPAGAHQIEFRFEPAMYKLGNTLVLVCSLLTYLVVLGGLFLHLRAVQKA